MKLNIDDRVYTKIFKYGYIKYISGSIKPYYVEFDTGQTWWCHEEELTKISSINKLKKLIRS